MYKAMQFAEEQIIARGKRLIFVAQGIDTDDSDSWQMLLSLHAMMDDLAGKHGVAFIRSSQIGKLLKGELHGALTFGYGLVDLQGTPNRFGRTPKKVIVCPKRSAYVVKIFKWFVEDRLNYKQIAHLLQNDPEAPKPVYTDRWSGRVVRNLLMNRRLIGDWSYGWTQNDWTPKPGRDGPAKVRLQTPQRVFWNDELRIISDELFTRAQARICSMPGFGGRKPQSGSHGPKHPLCGRIMCPKHGALWILGGIFWCKRCNRGLPADRVLFSGFNRALGLELICQALAQEIEARLPIVEDLIQNAKKMAQDDAEPDRSGIEALQRRLTKLAGNIDFQMDNPGDNDADLAESAAKLKDLRRQRADIAAAIVDAEQELAAPAAIPTVQEVRKIANNLVGVLKRAATANDSEVFQKLDVILGELIDGKIVCTQQGQPKRRLGWLRATFTLRLSRLVAGSVVPGVEPIEIQLDLKAPDPVEVNGSEIMQLYRQALTFRAIGKRLGIAKDRIRKYVHDYFRKNGFVEDDAKRGRLPRTVANGKSKHLLRTERIMKLYRKDWLYQQIADEFGFDIHVVGHVVRDQARDEHEQRTFR